MVKRDYLLRHSIGGGKQGLGSLHLQNISFPFLESGLKTRKCVYFMCRKLAAELIKHEQHFRRKCDICPEDLIDSWYQSSPTKIDSTHREDQCLELLDLPTKRNCFYLGVGASQGTPFPLLDR